MLYEVITDLVADVMLQVAAPSDGAVAAIANSGSIRTDIPNGDVTYGTVLATLPFDNT